MSPENLPVWLGVVQGAHQFRFKKLSPPKSFEAGSFKVEEKDEGIPQLFVCRRLHCPRELCPPLGHALRLLEGGERERSKCVHAYIRVCNGYICQASAQFFSERGQ